MNESLFRLFVALILFTSIAISAHFRRKADRDSGETIPRGVDSTAMMNVIRVCGLVLWLSPIVYLVSPRWIAWSKVGLPDWVRCAGIALGMLCVAGIYWLFSSIGGGISPTSATRTEHRLVTSGPYRWVRHPLYTVGSSLFVSLGMMADNWFIAALGILAFIVMAVRTPKEEANLIAKFGDEYRKYMQRTGRFFPRFRRAP